jgi:hypothetical protein
MPAFYNLGTKNLPLLNLGTCPQVYPSRLIMSPYLSKIMPSANKLVTWWKSCPPHSDILSDEIADHIVANSGDDQYG